MPSFSSSVIGLQRGLFDKEEGIERAVSNTPDWLVEYILDTIVSLAETQSTLNSDDVNRVLKANGYSLEGHENCMGGVFRKAAKMGWIRNGGYTRSKKEGRNGSVICQWESLLFSQSQS